MALEAISARERYALLMDSWTELFAGVVGGDPLGGRGVGADGEGGVAAVVAEPRLAALEGPHLYHAAATLAGAEKLGSAPSSAGHSGYGVGIRHAPGVV